MTEASEYHLGIRVDPPPQIQKEIRLMKRQFHLIYPGGNESFEPHVTLYFCRFPAERFDELCAELGQLNWQPFNLTIGQVLVRQEALNQRPFLFLDIAPSPELNALHRAVVKIANPLRSNLLRSKDEQRIAQGRYSPTDIERLRHYGCVRAMDGFAPHLTLGEVNPDQAEQPQQQVAASLTKVTRQSFTITDIGITLSEYEPSGQGNLKTVTERFIAFRADRSTP